MEKYTIKQLSEGEVAAKNDGTFEQLQATLILAFPKDPFRMRLEGGAIKNAKFFFLDSDTQDRWYYSDQTTLPNQSVKDFLEAEWKPKKGDDVLVRESEYTAWVKRIFFTEIEGCLNPYITVSYVDEIKFHEGFGFRITPWAEMKQLPPEEPKEPKIEFSVMVNGQETKLSLEKSEWDKLMSLNERT